MNAEAIEAWKTKANKMLADVLDALVDDLDAAKAAPRRNWPEKVEAGMCFEIPTFGTWMSLGNYGYACISGDRVGAHAEDISGTGVVYLGHARDILTIRTDAHEPTGAELVGEVCEFSDDGTFTDDIHNLPRRCIKFSPESDCPYMTEKGVPWKHARLAR